MGSHLWLLQVDHLVLTNCQCPLDGWNFSVWRCSRRRDLRVSEDIWRHQNAGVAPPERVHGVGNGGHVSCHFGTFVSNQWQLWKWWQLWSHSFSGCFYRVLLSWLWNYNYSTEKMAFHFQATKLGRFQHSNYCASKSWSEILSNCKHGSLCECRIGQLATFCLTFDCSHSNFHSVEGRWHFGMCGSPLRLHGDRVLSFVYPTQGDPERLHRGKCPGHVDGRLRRFRGTETHRCHGLGGLEDHLELRPALGAKLNHWDFWKEMFEGLKSSYGLGVFFLCAVGQPFENIHISFISIHEWWKNSEAEFLSNFF